MLLKDYVSAAQPLIELTLRSDAGPKVKHLLSRIFYGFEDFIEPGWVMASEKALEKYATLNQEMPLHNVRWDNQKKFDVDRKIIHWEHICTGMMFEKHLKHLQSEHRLTTESICSFIRENYRIAWILKSENKTLPRSDRGKNLKDALKIYADKGIVLVSLT